MGEPGAHAKALHGVDLTLIHVTADGSEHEAGGSMGLFSGRPT